MTRNQIRKQQYELQRRFSELSRLLRRGAPRVTGSEQEILECEKSRESRQLELENLSQQLEELDKMMQESRDEDEPQQEVYVPPGLTQNAPILVLLHGAGWTGGSQIEIWQSIAEREKIILLAPTSISDERDWGHRNDYKNLESRLYGAVTTLPVDQMRIYLVGHSKGGAQALRMGLVRPEWIAAMALHSPSMDQLILKGGFPYNPRRIPVRIWVGSDYELDSNRYWAEMMQIQFQANPGLVNLDLDIKLLDGHGHRDYNTRQGLLDEMWQFLNDKSR